MAFADMPAALAPSLGPLPRHLPTAPAQQAQQASQAAQAVQARQAQQVQQADLAAAGRSARPEHLDEPRLRTVARPRLRTVARPAPSPPPRSVWREKRPLWPAPRAPRPAPAPAVSRPAPPAPAPAAVRVPAPAAPVTPLPVRPRPQGREVRDARLGVFRHPPPSPVAGRMEPGEFIRDVLWRLGALFGLNATKSAVPGSR